MTEYLHPVAAVLALALLAYTASLGLRSRREPRRRRELLRRHAAVAPWMAAAVAASWLGGLGMVALTRPRAELAASGHFLLGTGMLALLLASATSSRWMDRARVRALHPWFGAALILLAAAQFFFGLQMLP